MVGLGKRSSWSCHIILILILIRPVRAKEYADALALCTSCENAFSGEGFIHLRQRRAHIKCLSVAVWLHFFSLSAWRVRCYAHRLAADTCINDTTCWITPQSDCQIITKTPQHWSQLALWSVLRPRVTLTFIGRQRCCWRRLVLEHHFSKPRRSTKREKNNRISDKDCSWWNNEKNKLQCWAVCKIFFFFFFEGAGMTQIFSTSLNKPLIGNDTAQSVSCFMIQLDLTIVINCPSMTWLYTTIWECLTLSHIHAAELIKSSRSVGMCRQRRTRQTAGKRTNDHERTQDIITTIVFLFFLI